jgi:hypothetical protein
MDRVEKKPNSKSPYADEPEISEWDRPLLETGMGRNDDRGLSSRGNAMDADVHNVPIGAEPRSEVTGAPDPGTTNETEDGLDEIEEGVRLSAEDTPTGDGREDAPSELPTFEQGLTAPKI